MGSGLAYSVVATHLHVEDAVTYQIFFAKYIFWVVAFPIIIIALDLVSGVSWATIFFNVFLSWVWYVIPNDMNLARQVRRADNLE